MSSVDSLLLTARIGPIEGNPSGHVTGDQRRPDQATTIAWFARNSIAVMAGAPPSATSLDVPKKSSFACIRCAERKVKCDRQRPCSACVSHKVGCVFQPPRPPRKRDRHARDQVLNDRLRYYETLLQQNGIDPKKLPHTPAGSDTQHQSNPTVAVTPKSSQLRTLYPVESEATGSVSKTQVIHSQGRSMFVDKSVCAHRVQLRIH